MLSEAALFSFIATLFSMMNPIGNIGVFAGMTADRPAADSRKIAWNCAIAVAITLLIVVWAGPRLLTLFGVTVDTLRAAGGLIVLVIGLHMLFNKSQHKHSAEELEDAQAQESIAVVPLAIPMVAGPGTMAAVLVAAQQESAILSKVEISLVIVGFSVLVGVLFSFASPIANRIGESGMGVVTRVMGMILAAIAMGMLTEGLKALLPGLAGQAG
ncbi:MAG: antibiotic resistance protein MarC [Gammaproteobacteria bacterium SG8_31]|jgi:multiple antibiotic resistance protein|nr:MAG: antibiotic resistance protein MarC [Gammaproteobacteria bacterium SG8_31]